MTEDQFRHIDLLHQVNLHRNSVTLATLILFSSTSIMTLSAWADLLACWLQRCPKSRRRSCTCQVGDGRLISRRRRRPTEIACASLWVRCRYRSGRIKMWSSWLFFWYISSIVGSVGDGVVAALFCSGTSSRPPWFSGWRPNGVKEIETEKWNWN